MLVNASCGLEHKLIWRCLAWHANVVCLDGAQVDTAPTTQGRCRRAPYYRAVTSDAGVVGGGGAAATGTRDCV